jgi:hypothetical protein
MGAKVVAKKCLGVELCVHVVAQQGRELHK